MTGKCGRNIEIVVKCKVERMRTPKWKKRREERS